MDSGSSKKTAPVQLTNRHAESMVARRRSTLERDTNVCQRHPLTTPGAKVLEVLKENP